MLGKCPDCGLRASITVFIDNDKASKALLAVLDVVPAGESIIKYLTLFRPEKRPLTMDKTASLLQELMPMLKAQSIKRDGISYAAPHPIWESAIEKMINARDMGTLQTPLKNHGYLLEVLITEGKRLSDDTVKKAEAKKQAERAKHDAHLADLQKRQAEAKSEAQPKVREKVVMPDAVREAWREALAKPQPVLLTPEEKEQRKREMIAEANRLQQTAHV